MRRWKLNSKRGMRKNELVKNIVRLIVKWLL